MTTHVSDHPLSPRLTVSKHRLANGLSLLTLPDLSAPVVSLQLWYRVGSRDEQPSRTGLAHLFEHLMFSRTAKLAAGEFDRLMEAAGGSTNAATWVDWTFYRDNVPASQLSLALRLEADRMQHLALTDEDVATEREVVANERRFRVDDDVDGFLAEELYRLAFRVHPYGHPTIGWMDDILATSTEDARAFYRAHYAPDRATLVLAGSFDPDETLTEVESLFGAIPPTGLAPAPVPAEAPQESTRRATFAKPVPADRAIFAYRSPPQAHPDWLALEVACEILCGGPSSRLVHRLVVDKEAASQIAGDVAPLRDPGLLEISVSMKRGHTAAEAEAILDEEAARLAADGPEPAELDKARTRLETAFWADLDNAEGKAEALGHTETTLDDYRRLFEIPRLLAALVPEDLARVARRYLVASSRTTVVAEPSGEAEEAS